MPQKLVNSIIISTPGVYDYKNSPYIWDGEDTSALFIYSNDVTVRNLHLATKPSYKSTPVIIGNSNSRFSNILLDGLTIFGGETLIQITNCDMVKIKNSNLNATSNTANVISIDNSTLVTVENSTLNQGDSSITVSGNSTGIIKGNKINKSNCGVNLTNVNSNSKWNIDDNSFYMTSNPCKFGKGKVRLCTQNNMFPSSNAGKLKNGIKDFNPMDLNMPNSMMYDNLMARATPTGGAVVRPPPAPKPAPTPAPVVKKKFNYKPYLIYGGIAIIVILIIIIIIAIIIKATGKGKNKNKPNK